MPSLLQTRIRFKKLDLSKSEIRLVQIHPAHNIEDSIECRLVNTVLEDDTEFIGLSVLYGDVSNTEQIILNGIGVHVPSALGQALRNVRSVFLDIPRSRRIASEDRHSAASKKTPRWLLRLFGGVNSISIFSDVRSEAGEQSLFLWVDLLCFNPEDEQEQSRRRSQMAAVYTSARMVVGWLGEKDETSDLAVHIIREVDKYMPANFGDPGDRQQHPENYGPEHQWMMNLKWMWDGPEGVTNPTQFPAFIAIKQFLSRPFLQHGWVIEEIAMATFPAFLVGNEIVSWMEVLRLNRNNEELIDNGSKLFPDEYRSLIHFMPLDTIYTLLEEFDRRRRYADPAVAMVPATGSASASLTAMPSFTSLSKQ